MMTRQKNKIKLTVSIAFPVLSSFNVGPFMSVSRKKCFPLIVSVIAISLTSCMFHEHIENQLHNQQLVCLETEGTKTFVKLFNSAYRHLHLLVLYEFIKLRHAGKTRNPCNSRKAFNLRRNKSA